MSYNSKMLTNLLQTKQNTFSIEFQIVSKQQNRFKRLKISILSNIKALTFVQKLKEFSKKYIFRRLEKKQFQIYGDNASSYSYYTNRKLIIGDKRNKKDKLRLSL